MFLHLSEILFTRWGVSVQRGSLSGVEWSLSRGSLSRGLYPGGVSVQVGLCQGYSLYSKEQVVCILLECILVLHMVR